jgi:hypothetical protein
MHWQKRNTEGFYRIGYKCPLFYWVCTQKRTRRRKQMRCIFEEEEPEENEEEDFEEDEW